MARSRSMARTARVDSVGGVAWSRRRRAIPHSPRQCARRPDERRRRPPEVAARLVASATPAMRRMTALLLSRRSWCSSCSTAFFVAAEFALVRVAPGAPRGGRRGGRTRRRDSRCAIMDDLIALPVGLPARHHAHLAGHRLPRRAGGRASCSSRCSATTSPHWVSLGDLARARLPDHDRRCTSRSASRSRRSTRSRRPSRSRAASRGRCSSSRRSSSPFIALLNARVQRDPAAARRRDRRASSTRASTPEELKVLIQQSLTGGKLDPGEAGMLTGVFHLHEQQARQVMTPAPAVVTVDVSEDVETALRRCVSSGHTRLVVTEDENHDRVKGIVHANALAQLLLAEGAAGVDRGARARGADRARDQAARRPAGRPPAPAHRRWRS